MLSLTVCTQSKDTSKSNSTAKKITGKIVKANLNDGGNIRPTLYLSNNIKFKKGTGTRLDPYQLQVS